MILIPDEFFKSNEFLKWFGTKECNLYYFLRSYVVRKSHLFDRPWHHPGYFMYHNYFKNGMLVARYSQEDLANIHQTAKRKIIDRLKSLSNRGFVRKIKTRKGSVDVMYYQLGTWSGEWNTQTYKEIYFLDELYNLKTQEELMRRRIKNASDQNGHPESVFPGDQNGHPYNLNELSLLL